MKILEESAEYYTTQRLANKERMILKKCFFSDIWIIEICGQEHRQEYTQQTETQIIENQTETESSITALIFTQEDRKNFKW